MGYIPTNILPYNGANVKSFILPAPDMGVCFDTGEDNGEKRCSKAVNVISQSGCVKSRPEFEPCSSFPENAGAYHGKSDREYMGSIIFHMGTSLYRFDAEKESVTQIFSEIDDTDSMMCRFLSKLYIFCNYRIFSVDKDFVCTEEEPFAPHMYQVSSTGLVTKIKAEDGAVLNLASPRITVTFAFRNEHSYAFPVNCDITRPIVVKRDGEVLSNSKYTVTESKLKILDFGNTGDLTVEYYFDTTDEEIEYNDLFYGCTRCISYGGNDIGGTRIIASGNSKRKGEYCKSSLLDPLYFPINETETIGDGCDNVTAFLPVYEYLMIFTERSVYRMSYTLKDDGGFFSIKHINDTAGCDIAQSVRLCDNRAVFANFREGVFTVYHEDESGVHNVKPISGNINLSGDGKQGLLSLSPSELKDGKSAVLGEKYYLLAGNYIFVWDFGRCSYYSSSSFEKSQGRLIWHIWQAESFADLFEAQGKLFALSKDGITVKKLCDGSQKQFCPQSSFTVKETDFGTPFALKYVTEITSDIYCRDKSEITFSLYGDGEKYHSFSVKPVSDGRRKITVSLPEKALYRLGVEVSSNGGGFEFYGAAIKVKYV